MTKLYGYVTFDHKKRGSFQKHCPNDFDDATDHPVAVCNEPDKDHNILGYLIHDPLMSWHGSFSEIKTSDHDIPLMSLKN